MEYSNEFQHLQRSYYNLLELYQQLLTSWKELVKRINELCNLSQTWVNWDLWSENQTGNHTWSYQSYPEYTTQAKPTIEHAYARPTAHESMYK